MVGALLPEGQVADIPPNSFISIDVLSTIGTGIRSPLKPGVLGPTIADADPEGAYR